MKININNFNSVKGVNGIYAIGLADALITIRSQQIRAICFADLLTGIIPSERRKNIAILGGGIAGLTVAARLLQHGWSDVVIYERLPDLLSVQNGCDTRWIHPKIIAWPKPGCREVDAGLPILNWSSSTASDVTCKIEEEWGRLVDNLGGGGVGKPARKLSVLLGVSFLRVSVVAKNVRGRPRQRNILSVEWIRDTRVEHRKIQGDLVRPSGVKSYEHLVFATGFGLETNARDSYWRNESLGQIGLDGVQRRFLVSGFGDGALIDLLRLTIKNFRPDRVLKDLKLDALEVLLNNSGRGSFVNDLDAILSKNKRSEATVQLFDLINYFKQRQREDTYVIVNCLGSKGFRRSLDDSPAARINKLFVYAVYKIGGFQYVESDRPEKEGDVALRYAVPHENIIRRHGVDRKAVLDDLMPESKSNEFVKTGLPGRPKKSKALLEVVLKKQDVDACEKIVWICELCTSLQKLKKSKKSPI